MTVDEELLPYRNRPRPMVEGRMGASAPLSRSADKCPTRNTEDEVAIAFVPPPVSLTRVFPGL